MLRGGSVIDWHRLGFHDHAAVDRFLRVNEFDPDDDEEMARLEELRLDAVEYLARTFTFGVPEEIAEVVPARDLFLIASREGPNRKWACVILKVMHIIHHLAGREALVRLPISDDNVFHAIELKVMQVIEELRAAGYPIAEFEWSRKPRDSLITKLLAKRSTLAAKVYDKLRFRLIVKDRQDLLPMLAVLTRQLIPFNYVVPGESINKLLSFEHELQASPTLREVSSSLQRESESDGEPYNEFSALEYRIINFVADLPLRIGAILDERCLPPECGHVVFVLTEFQLCDKASAMQNELGSSSHEAYKARQLDRVCVRLLTEGDKP